MRHLMPVPPRTINTSQEVKSDETLSRKTLTPFVHSAGHLVGSTSIFRGLSSFSIPSFISFQSCRRQILAPDSISWTRRTSTGGVAQSAGGGIRTPRSYCAWLCEHRMIIITGQGTLVVLTQQITQQTVMVRLLKIRMIPPVGILRGQRLLTRREESV
jgi:hypothetical protein